MTRAPDWTNDDEIMRTVYPVLGTEGVKDILWYRSRNAIINRASVLRLKAPVMTLEDKMRRNLAISAGMQKHLDEQPDPVPVRQIWLQPGQWATPVVTGPRSIFEVAS